MSGKTLGIIKIIIAVVLALVVAWSITVENVLIPVVAVIAATAIGYLARRRTREVTQDERTALVYEKAAAVTIRVCVPVLAVIGLVLFGLRGSLAADMAGAGYVLAYSACFILLVHSAFYSYYARKH